MTKANILHKRVHNPDRSYTSRDKKVLTSVTVFNDDLNLYGVTDCIEVPRNFDTNEELTKSSEHHIQALPQAGSIEPNITIVEYKPRHPLNDEYNEEDLIQVFAQKVCIDWMFHCHTKGVIFYADVKKRVKLPLEEHYEEYFDKLTIILNEIHQNIQTGTIPPIPLKQKCRGCSFLDLCMPKVDFKKRKDVLQQLEDMYSCENC